MYEQIAVARPNKNQPGGYVFQTVPDGSSQRWFPVYKRVDSHQENLDLTQRYEQLLAEKDGIIDTMVGVGAVQERRVDELVGMVDALSEELAQLRGHIGELCDANYSQGYRHGHLNAERDSRQVDEAAQIEAYQKGLGEGMVQGAALVEHQLRREIGLMLHRCGEDVRRGDTHPAANRQHVRG